MYHYLQRTEYLAHHMIGADIVDDGIRGNHNRGDKKAEQENKYCGYVKIGIAAYPQGKTKKHYTTEGERGKDYFVMRQSPAETTVNKRTQKKPSSQKHN